MEHVSNATDLVIDKFEKPDAYRYWRDALAVGKGRQIGKAEAAAAGLQITMEPACGFYRKRNKEGRDAPVAIWRDDAGALVARIGDRLVDAADIWTWCCAWPVAEDVCRAVMDGGEWPDEPPAVVAATGHNSGAADPREALRIELDGEIEQAEQFMRSEITTQEDADRASVWAKRLADLSKRADKEREAEKAPHLQACRDVDDAWRPVVAGAKEWATKLKRHVEPYLVAEKRKADEARRKAQEEADRARREAEQIADEQERAARLKAAQDAEKATEARNASAGRTGARVSLRTEKVGRVTDYQKAAAALVAMNHADMMKLIDQLANRAARVGQAFDGMEIREVEKAV